MRNYSETHERVRHIPKKNYDQIKTGRMEIEPHIIDTPIVISNPLVKNEVLEVISTKGGDPLVKSYEETMHVDLPRKAHKAIVEGQVNNNFVPTILLMHIVYRSTMLQRFLVYQKNKRLLVAFEFSFQQKLQRRQRLIIQFHGKSNWILNKDGRIR